MKYEIHDNDAVNWDLVTEHTVWTPAYKKNKDMVWNKDLKRVDKKEMEVEEEYIIF